MGVEQSSNTAAICRVYFPDDDPEFAVNRGFQSVERVAGQPTGAFILRADQVSGGFSLSDTIAIVTPSTYTLTPAAGQQEAKGELFLDGDGEVKVRVSCSGDAESPYANPQLADVPFNVEIKRIN